VKLDKYAVRIRNKAGDGHSWFPVLAADEANALARVEAQRYVVVEARVLSEIDANGITDDGERDSLLALQQAPPESWELAG
jgi:hypothetical protein